MADPEEVFAAAFDHLASVRRNLATARDRLDSSKRDVERYTREVESLEESITVARDLFRHVEGASPTEINRMVGIGGTGRDEFEITMPEGWRGPKFDPNRHQPGPQVVRIKRPEDPKKGPRVVGKAPIVGGASGGGEGTVDLGAIRNMTVVISE